MILLSKQFEKKFHLLVAISVYGLKAIGLAPFSYQILKSEEKSGDSTIVARVFRFSRIGLAYNILLIVLFLVMTKPGIDHLLPALNKKGVIAWLMLSLSELANCLTVYVILISSTFWQHNAVSFMNRLLEVERLLNGIEKKPLPSKKMCIVFSFHLIISSTLWTGAFLRAVLVKRVDGILPWLWYSANFFIIYWFVVEYSIVVKLLVREFKRVNKNLLNIGSVKKHLFRPQFPADYLAVISSSSTQSQLDPTKLLIEIRTRLFEASRDVANFFSFPILLSVACLFYKLIIDVKYFLMSISTNAKTNHVKFLSALLTDIYSVVLLSLSVTEATREAKLTRRIVHKLAATATRDEMKTELQDFSLQLLHEDVVYTAHGFFTLDNTMLHSMVDATTTYIVLLMQNVD